MYAPLSSPIETAHHIGLVLIRRPCSFSKLIHLIAVPYMELRNLDTDVARQPHHSGLVRHEPRVAPVGCFHDPVATLAMGRENQPVTLLAHGELQSHPRQGEAQASGRLRHIHGTISRRLETLVKMRTRIGDDLDRSRKIPSDPHKQVDLTTSTHPLLASDQLPEASLGQEIGEPRGHPIGRPRLLARMVLEPAPQHRTVRAIPVVSVEDELREGVSAMDRTDMLPVEEDRVDRLHHDASLSCQSSSVM